MEKNNSNSQFVNVADVMDAQNKSTEMAQRVMRAIRKKCGKVLCQLTTVINYGEYYGLTEEQAKKALGRTY